MLIFVLAYLGGVLTILSPCILPVLPFVFARADRPFVRSGLPMPVGMIITFAIIATLAAVAGSWAVTANQYGRIAALVLLGVFGLTLLLPEFADRLMRPLVALGSRLSQSADGNPSERGSIVASLLLGFATGLLWAPCAGPILGLILTGAALNGANVQTSLLLITYAAGAATSLALALLIGGRVFTAMKRSLGVGEWVRRGLGAAVLAAIVAIAFGLDTGFLTKISLNSTANLEQGLLDRLKPNAAGVASDAASSATKAPAPGEALPDEGPFPSLAGAVEWLNSPPLTNEALKGKVVLIDFWTYSCINCLRTLPYVRAWAEKYKDQGLVVIGVHAPEFAFEKDIANVRKAVTGLKIGYPVAVDNDFAIWRGFDNSYWPAHYFIDAQGRIRHHHFGDGDYEGSERVIQRLLAETGKTALSSDLVKVGISGVATAAANDDNISSETYVGYNRAENFVSPGGIVKDTAHVYVAGTPKLNEWGLNGKWIVVDEHAALADAQGSIVYRFRGRDLNLVLGPGPEGKPVRFQVSVDGKPIGADQGVDTDADGSGVVNEQRLYQLVRQGNGVGEQTVEIKFLDPGVHAYAFTFG